MGLLLQYVFLTASLKQVVVRADVLTVFLGLSTVSFIGIYYFFPETAHKTLEEIGALFGDEIAPGAADTDGELCPEAHHNAERVEEKDPIVHLEGVFP